MKRYSQIHKTKPPLKTYLLLNGVFVSNAFCSIQCIILHISDNFHPDVCKYGTTICICLYFIAKTFLYIFLIERGKCSQGVISMFPKILFDKILPIYICLYLIFFMITVPIFFRGLIWTDNVHLAIYPKGITGCLFNEGLPTILYIGCALDILNTVILLFLFIYPLHILFEQRRAIFNKTLNWRGLLLTLILINLIQAQYQQCPCNQLTDGRGRCSCYTCINQRPWAADDVTAIFHDYDNKYTAN